MRQCRTLPPNMEHGHIFLSSEALEPSMALGKSFLLPEIRLLPELLCKLITLLLQEKPPNTISTHKDHLGERLA